MVGIAEKKLAKQREQYKDKETKIREEALQIKINIKKALQENAELEAAQKV